MGQPIDDPINGAIAATEPQPVQMMKVDITIASTGRPAMVGIPMDISEAELFELVGWMSTGLRTAVRERAAKEAGPQLVIARGLPPPS